MVPESAPFDPAEHLDDLMAQAKLVSDAFATGDAQIINKALDTVTRARNVSKLAEQAGVTRDTLYKAFREKDDPRLSTLVGVLDALGLQVVVERPPA